MKGQNIMKKAIINRVQFKNETDAIITPRIGDSDEPRQGKIIDYGLNAPSPFGVVDWYIVEREDGRFYLSYTTIPRDKAVANCGAAVIQREFPGMSDIPLIIETVLDDSEG